MHPQRRLSGEIEAASRRRVESLGEGRLADRHNLQARPCRRSFEDQLSWHTQCIGEDSAQALVALHHIASDGWSWGPFARDLARAYTARRAGQAPELPALPVQY